ILSIAIVFPLVFSITSAYQRRQDFIRHYTGISSKGNDINGLEGIWIVYIGVKEKPSAWEGLLLL
ncbi:MAG: hypothetical protein HOG64_02865, partial [Flavobacteriaceae bacterium]|nr:hypothetical protein [Flavobacteriaceae bacterium]